MKKNVTLAVVCILFASLMSSCGLASRVLKLPGQTIKNAGGILGF